MCPARRNRAACDAGKIGDWLCHLITIILLDKTAVFNQEIAMANAATI